MSKYEELTVKQTGDYQWTVLAKVPLAPCITEEVHLGHYTTKEAALAAAEEALRGE